MEINDFEVILSTPPYREHPVVECYYNNIQFAEILDETDIVQIQLYWYKENPMWEFSFDEVMNVFDKAKKWLIREE